MILQRLGALLSADLSGASSVCSVMVAGSLQPRWWLLAAVLGFAGALALCLVRHPRSLPEPDNAMMRVVVTCAEMPRPLFSPTAGNAIAPADPPEPIEPEIECLFERVVHCEPESPTLSAVGPQGFESCPRTSDAVASTRSVGKPPVARLSAVETRRARRRDPHTCCYIEYVATACR